MPLYHSNSLCSFLTGLGCPNCIEYFTSQGLQNIYHLQNLTIEVTAPAGAKDPFPRQSLLFRGIPLLPCEGSWGVWETLLYCHIEPCDIDSCTSGAKSGVQAVGSQWSLGFSLTHCGQAAFGSGVQAVSKTERIGRQMPDGS